MTPPMDIERVSALIALLALPDASDLRSERAGRGHQITYEADARKRERFLERVHAV